MLTSGTAEYFAHHNLSSDCTRISGPSKLLLKSVEKVEIRNRTTLRCILISIQIKAITEAKIKVMMTGKYLMK